MNIYKIVQKLIGEIRPVGDSRVDAERFENLKAMTGLVDQLLSDIDSVIPYKNNHQASMKKAGEFADEFFSSLGIDE